MTKIYIVESDIVTREQYGESVTQVCAVFDSMEKAIAGKAYYEQRIARTARGQYLVYIKEFDLNAWN